MIIICVSYIYIISSKFFIYFTKSSFCYTNHAKQRFTTTLTLTYLVWSLMLFQFPFHRNYMAVCMYVIILLLLYRY